MSFAELIASASPLDDGFALSVPQTWLQGRTAYGGLSATLALSAAQQVGGEGLAPLRSAAISFVGPASGAITAHARVLRRGKNAVWIGAGLHSGDAVVLMATFVFMGAVKSSVHLNTNAPPAGLIPAGDAQTFAPHPLMPTFLRENFETRFAYPRIAGKAPELSWWLRLKDRRGLDPFQELLLIADCLPPGVLPLMPPGTPVSSMTWQANCLTAAPMTEDGWWLLRSHSDYAEQGCSSQIMQVWNTDGAPVMAGMQSIALFG